MVIPLPKLKAALLYFCENTDPKFLGKVKLMKLFYFLDFMHVKKYGIPITFDSYVHLEHGPIPSTIKNLVDEVCDDIDTSILADTIYCHTQEGQLIQRIIPKRKLTEKDIKYFSKSEIETLELVCDRFGAKNTEYIKDASHKEAPWLETSILETISYALAVKDRDCQVSKQEIELLLTIYSK